MFQRLLFLVLLVTLITLLVTNQERKDRFREIEQAKKCERRVRIGQEHEFEILLLASFPGSGNTWVRLLLEDATGIYTGSVYIDKSLGKSGFLGEYEDQESGTTIAVKCHGFNGMALRGIAKGAILLIRNPFDAILAEWNRRRSPKPEQGSAASHTGTAPPELFNSTLWAKQCEGYTNRWYELHKRYASQIHENTQLKIIFYEDIRDNLRYQVEQMYAFINEVNGKKLNQTNEDIATRLECIEWRAADAAEKYKRKKKPLGFNPFSQNQTELINKKIRHINRLFKEKGFPKLPGSYIQNWDEQNLHYQNGGD